MLSFRPGNRGALRLLCLGAHADDLEIGCGGTLLELLSRSGAVEVTWLVFSGHGRRGEEARSSAAAFLKGSRRAEVKVEQFRDGFFPSQLAAIKEYFEALKRRVSPDLIFTHHRDDLHQDHRVISELTWNTFRDHAIFEYEILKYDGGLASPNVFVPLSGALARRKVKLTMRAFASQRSRRWFREQSFLGLMSVRGVECNSASGYAEAFYGRKIVL